MSKILKTSLLAWFAIPMAAKAVILSGVTVTSASPSFSGGYDSSFAVDRSSTEYASLGAGLSTFLNFSLGAAPQSFDRIVVVNRDSGSANDLISTFTITPGGGSPVAITGTGARGSSLAYSMGGVITTSTVNLQVTSVVGTGTVGNVGVSEVYFLRSPLNSVPVSGVSVINASPAYSGGGNYIADKIVDGLIGRSNGAESVEYASAAGASLFVDFNLGSLKSVTGFDYFDRPAATDRTDAFSLTFSQNATFGDGDDVVKTYANTSAAQSDEFAGVSAQYVRYNVTATSAGFAGLSELTFYQAVPEVSTALLGLLALPLALKRRR